MYTFPVIFLQTDRENVHNETLTVVVYDIITLTIDTQISYGTNLIIKKRKIILYNSVVQI